MRGDELLDNMECIDADLIEAADAKPKKKARPWVKWGSMAACLCLVVIGAIIISQSTNPTPSGNGITISGDGVTIPQMEISLSSDTQADMLGFFIYQGRCYVQYEWIYDDVDFIGEYLGTATGLIDEWTAREGYVELAGSVKGNFYSVKGFDPTFMLCMKYESGAVSTYINDNGITLKTGADLFEERLHLSGNYAGVQYQTRTSWYNSADEIFELNDEYKETVANFVAALNSALFMRTEDIPLDEGQANVYDKEIYHLYFKMNNGMTIHLRLYEGGYVHFDGIRDVCVQVQDESINRLLDLFSNEEAAIPVVQQDKFPTLEDCLNDESFGAYVPSYVPEGTIFESSEFLYNIDQATGSSTGTKQITLNYSGNIEYSVEIAWADSYGENGWAGPMLYSSDLTPEAVSEYISTEKSNGEPRDPSWTAFGVWFDDVMVVISGYGLNAQTAYDIMASVSE